ncbi:MAG: hypothetical protein R2778_03660 [Saprospiraceae bacterium]
MFNESVNGQNNLPLSYSDFDLGHRFVAFLSKTFKYGGNIGGATTVSLFYTGESGQRFSYTYGGNLVRNSTRTGQDLIYIPATMSDINLIDDASWELLLNSGPRWMLSFRLMTILAKTEADMPSVTVDVFLSPTILI